MATEEFEPAIYTLSQDSGREIASVLSSDSTRPIFEVIESQAATPVEIAEGLDMTLQNVHYHVEKLEEAGLIEVTGIEYSDRGREMHIYESVHDEVILCQDSATKDQLDRLLKRLLDGSMVAIILSAITHLVYTRVLEYGPQSGATSSTSLRSDTGTSQASDTISTIPWWEYPSVWVFLVLFSATVVYTMWRHRRDRPPFERTT